MKTKLVDLACPFALGNVIWARLPKCKELTFFRLYRILLLLLRLKELTSILLQLRQELILLMEAICAVVT